MFYPHFFSTFQTQIIYRPGIQEVHITQGPIVMTCPAAMPTATHMSLTSHMHGDVVTTGNATSAPSVTATVMMSPPDYHVAASRIPRYSSVSTPPGISYLNYQRLLILCRVKNC